MPSIRTLALAVLLACAAPMALAQIAQPAIEKQMTPEEFKAAGLDKLNADELARLNTWLGRTIETETAKVAADTKQKIEHENRGFFDFGSQEPITGRIAGEFRGFAKGRTYTLDNGQLWQQIDDTEMSAGRLTDPAVNIKPALIGNSWYMQVGRYNTRAQVRRIK
jgi:hypothetical protein